MSYDVFISFSFKDQSLANSIYNDLVNKYGLNVWICDKEILGGENYKTAILKALPESKCVLLLQTPHSVNSTEIPSEVSIARRLGLRIIPVKFDGAVFTNTVAYDIPDNNILEVSTPPTDAEMNLIAASIRKAVADREQSLGVGGNPSTSTNMPTVSSYTAYRLESTLVELSTDNVFVGRENLMDEIHSELNSRRVVFLQGLGGIGKSELSKRYYLKYSSEYSTVVFARYEGDLAELIADDLVFKVKGCSRMITHVDGRDVPQSDEEYAKSKIDALKKSCDGRTLIIIDNFDTEWTKEPLFKTFTDKAPYKVLITTRNKQPKYKEINIKELDDISLKKLFIEYSGGDTSKIR